MTVESPSLMTMDAAAIVDALVNWHAMRGLEAFDRMQGATALDGHWSPSYAAAEAIWNLPSTACDALKVVRDVVEQSEYGDRSARVKFFKALRKCGEDVCIPMYPAARAGLDEATS